MSLADIRRERYRRLAYHYRSLPGEHGLRPYDVAIVAEEWSGARLGDGTRSEIVTLILERDGMPPKVRNLDSEELALAGYDQATYQIGPITPLNADGGTLLATLDRSATELNTDVYIRLTGSEFVNGARFRVKRSQFDKALHYTLDVQRVADGGT